MNEYDVVVVGSDEVWNLIHPWYGKCPLLYGEGLKARRLISYAASFGNYDAWWNLDPVWADKLRNFDFISVRGHNSRALVQNAIGIEPEMVLDPCLQFPVEPDERHSSTMRAPYVAVYGHNFSGSFGQEIRRWAHERKLPVVSIGYRNDWADEQWITADPHDFAYFMAQAEAVATNFFHGCVFALRNKKPFVCEVSPYRSQKILGLMAKIEAKQHLVMEDTPTAVFQTRLSEPLDPAISKNIDQFRQISAAYLNQALDLQQIKYV